MDGTSTKDKQEESEKSHEASEMPKDASKEAAGRGSAQSKFANQESSGLLNISPKVDDCATESDTVDQKSVSVAPSSTVGAEEMGASESSARVSQDGSLPPKKPKKDRSNLRKGKWTVSTIAEVALS